MGIPETGTYTQPPPDPRLMALSVELRKAAAETRDAAEIVSRFDGPRNTWPDRLCGIAEGIDYAARITLVHASRLQGIA